MWRRQSSGGAGAKCFRSPTPSPRQKDWGQEDVLEGESGVASPLPLATALQKTMRIIPLAPIPQLIARVILSLVMTTQRDDGTTGRRTTRLRAGRRPGFANLGVLSVCPSFLPKFRVFRVSWFPLSVLPRETGGKPTTEYTEHTEGPTIRFFSIPSGPGLPWFPNQGIPSLSQANQGKPSHPAPQLRIGISRWPAGHKLESAKISETVSPARSP